MKIRAVIEHGKLCKKIFEGLLWQGYHYRSAIMLLDLDITSLIDMFVMIRY